jgi:hypothetical protein
MQAQEKLKRKRNENIIQVIDVVDLILLDHQFLKECIETLTSEEEDKRKKLSVGRGFIEALAKHSLAEKKAIYAPLESNEELHFNILEGQIEHGIVDKKVKMLKMRLNRARTLHDEVEAELKVLAELVKHHVKEEESELLPKMREEVTEEELKNMGIKFMKLRKFEKAELSHIPHLRDELIQWKDSVQKISSQFLNKMDKYVENLKH